MSVLSLGYAYRPRSAGRKVTGRSTGWARTLRRIFLVLVLLLPWVWSSYQFVRYRRAMEVRNRLLQRQEALLTRWENLTAEEKVRRMVAPKGLFKPTEKEILRLP
ncbi:hypothetical protein [Thermosulfurimonas sp.]|uniref:hypothetical protein n=1 Tax=Thermosulfurimonas sp. TaxID=2080236 RepID=UPI0025D03CF0|nr:hypothetical protein [Thermosulfurimonas sp.]